ncbi:unnamed protein product [Dovyalis caffra]|uniref:Uncharacterized protein n=1 Tax=Dovyalis caffra TaxID=77055 RepID=A0AAV1QSZ3_9ROSI|nr:unnamed protein product [Dovyalis caffra]
MGPRMSASVAVVGPNVGIGFLSKKRGTLMSGSCVGAKVRGTGFTQRPIRCPFGNMLLNSCGSHGKRWLRFGSVCHDDHVVSLNDWSSLLSNFKSHILMVEKFPKIFSSERVMRGLGSSNVLIFKLQKLRRPKRLQEQPK